MEITFQGNKPQKKTYSYSVKENNKSNTITFILNKEIEGLDLSSLSCYVKVQGSEIDKDVPTIEVEEDKIKVIWTLLRKHTISRVLKVQLQFEGTSDIVWQSEIVEIVLSDTIKADQYIENKYPSVLTNHEGRITTLEEKAIEPSDYYDKEETNQLLDGKQDKLTFDNVPTENSNNPVKSGGVYASLQNVIEIAEGKSQSFTLSIETQGNEDFNSQEGSIELASFTDINGNVIDTSKLKVGDIILITQLNVPDRWVGNILNGVATFYRMETTKVDLTAYYTKAESDQKFIDKTSDQEIEGKKTIKDTSLEFSKTGVGGNAKYEIEEDKYGRILFSRTYNGVKTTLWIFDGTLLRPYNNNTNPIGSSTNRLSNIYVEKIGRNNANYGFVLPDMSQWTANKEIATTDQVNVKANESVISDQYDNTKTYAVDDLVIYNNALYRCKTTITTAEDFDSSKWEITNIQSAFIRNFGGNIGKDRARVPNIYVGSLNATYLRGGLNCWDTIKTGNVGHLNIDIGSKDRPFRNLVIWNLLKDDNDNSVSIADLKALIDYAKSQGWIS